MDCIGVGWMTRSINRSHYQLGLALEWLLGLLGSIFHGKKEYFSRYNLPTYNLMFYVGLGRMGGSRRMGSDDDFRISQVLPIGSVLLLGSLGSVFHSK